MAKDIILTMTVEFRAGDVMSQHYRLYPSWTKMATGKMLDGNLLKAAYLRLLCQCNTQKCRREEDSKQDFWITC